jgi:hypothetical protein
VIKVHFLPFAAHPNPALFQPFASLASESFDEARFQFILLFGFTTHRDTNRRRMGSKDNIEDVLQTLTLDEKVRLDMHAWR